MKTGEMKKKLSGINKTMLVSLFSLISNIKVISNYSYLMKLLMI